MYVYETILSPGVCLPQPRGYIHVYFHNIQTSSAMKVFGQSKPNFMWTILRKLERMLYSLDLWHWRLKLHNVFIYQISGERLQDHW